MHRLMQFRRALLSIVLACGALPPAAQAAESQTIVVYGARAQIGQVIVDEALARGHRVVGVSRHPGSLELRHANFTAAQGDVTDADSVKALIADADAVIVSLSGNGPDNAPEHSTHARAAATMVEVLSALGDAGPRVLQIGGATTMYGDKAAMQAKLPFPAPEGSPMYGMLFGHLEALDAYRASDIEWTVVTPPLDIVGYRAGEDRRTGQYRTATEALVTDAQGRSSITLSDLAVATIDEVENARFVRQRFTVGY